MYVKYHARHRRPLSAARRHLRSHRAMTFTVVAIVAGVLILGMLYAYRHGAAAFLNGSS